MLSLSPQKDCRPMMAAVDCWYGRIKAGMQRLKYAKLSLHNLKHVSKASGEPEFTGPDFVSHDYCDASLLFRRMARLGIERNQLAEDDPLLFRELQGFCTLCPSRPRCAQHLAHEFEDPAWQDWRDYCPNSTILNALSALSALQSGR